MRGEGYGVRGRCVSCGHLLCADRDHRYRWYRDRTGGSHLVAIATMILYFLLLTVCF